MNYKYKFTLFLGTFDVQSVTRINFSADGIICLAICFVSGSAATGCQINLECASITFLFHVDGYNIQFHELWCSPRIPLSGNETCLLQVYDRADQINQNTSGPAVADTINVTVAILPSPSVTPSNGIHYYYYYVIIILFKECSSRIIAVAVITAILLIIIVILSIIIVILSIIIAIFIVNGRSTHDM